jgi:hypothetical protein
MANYPQELAQDAVCQSHTGHMTGLWFLSTWPLRLNTDDDGDYILCINWKIKCLIVYFGFLCNFCLKYFLFQDVFREILS